MTAFCEACGGNLQDQDQFCPGCGRSTSASAESFVGGSVNIGRLRHPKEEAYFIMGAVAGGFVWFLIIWFVWIFLIPLAIVSWLAEQFFMAQVLGNSVKVSKSQYPEINEIVESHCRTLRLTSRPDVYVLNGNGLVNALAIRFLRKKHVILFGDLVDLMLASGSTSELSSVIGHELGHHAAGHTSIWRQLLLWPSRFVPFFGYAYLRACELTADRIGMYLAGNKDAAIRGLIALACGSRALMPNTSIDAFKNQERMLPEFFAFLLNLWSTHPRITKRVLELESATHLLRT